MTAVLTTRRPPVRRAALWSDLDHPRQALSAVTPNWFAVVMGTGIVAVAASSLPWQPGWLHPAAVVVWALAVLVLLVVLLATAGHWVTHPQVARRHHLDPVAAPFHGAAPMALLTVGAGTLLVGRDVVGLPVAVTVDAALWTLGTVAGLATAAVVPFLQRTRHGVTRADARPGWLMSVVPPMVSASTGALLVPHLPAGAPRVALLLGCYALAALALAASVVVGALAVTALVRQGPGASGAVPTWWIVLGPLGQFVTALNLLGGAAAVALPAHDAAALHSVGVVVGVPVWGVALAWAGVALRLTVRAARDHLPFSLTWWSFTFPVGTVVTGSSGLALHTGSPVFAVVAVGLFGALVAAWAVVFARTALGVARGHLLLAAPVVARATIAG